MEVNYESSSLYHPINVVDQLLDSFFESPFVPFTGNPILNKLPLVDVQETESAYLVEAELPGFDEKQIRVHMEGGKLSIEAGKDEKEEKKNEEKDGAYLIKERRKVSFSRSFTLPDNTDRDSIGAVFKNGVLSVEIGKLAEAQKKVIQISKN